MGACCGGSRGAKVDPKTGKMLDTKVAKGKTAKGAKKTVAKTTVTKGADKAK